MEDASPGNLARFLRPSLNKYIPPAGRLTHTLRRSLRRPLEEFYADTPSPPPAFLSGSARGCSRGRGDGRRIGHDPRGGRRWGAREPTWRTQASVPVPSPKDHGCGACSSRLPPPRPRQGPRIVRGVGGTDTADLLVSLAGDGLRGRQGGRVPGRRGSLSGEDSTRRGQGEGTPAPGTGDRTPPSGSGSHRRLSAGSARSSGSSGGGSGGGGGGRDWSTPDQAQGEERRVRVGASSPGLADTSATRRLLRESARSFGSHGSRSRRYDGSDSHPRGRGRSHASGGPAHGSSHGHRHGHSQSRSRSRGHGHDQHDRSGGRSGIARTSRTSNGVHRTRSAGVTRHGSAKDDASSISTIDSRQSDGAETLDSDRVGDVPRGQGVGGHGHHPPPSSR
jgi:hypothetical protein